MATGKASDFSVYQAEFTTGLVETLIQETNTFNAASRGCIRLVPRRLEGNYLYESFIEQIASLAARRDTTSVSAQTDTAMTEDEHISVKRDRKIKSVSQTLDAWRKKGWSGEEGMRQMSLKLGQQIAKEVTADMVNAACISLQAAISGQANLVYDATGQTTTTLTHAHLANGLRKLGDAANNVLVWLMHSEPWYDLMVNSLATANMITNVGGVVVNEGTIGTLNRPAIITDSSGLTSGSGSSTQYQVLGLVPGACTVLESEPFELYQDVVTGLENVIYRIQGEYAYNVGCKGFKWDVATGSSNPTDATLGTSTNWDKAAVQDKFLAGVQVTVTT